MQYLQSSWLFLFFFSLLSNVSNFSTPSNDFCLTVFTDLHGWTRLEKKKFVTVCYRSIWMEGLSSICIIQVTCCVLSKTFCLNPLQDLKNTSLLLDLKMVKNKKAGSHTFCPWLSVFNGVAVISFISVKARDAWRKTANDTPCNELKNKLTRNIPFHRLYSPKKKSYRILLLTRADNLLISGQGETIMWTLITLKKK